MPQHLHQFGNLAALILLVARFNGMGHAMGDMVLQHLFLDALQRCPHGGDLRDNVNAIAVIIDHLHDAAHLALDLLQAGATCCLDFFLHPCIIPH